MDVIWLSVPSTGSNWLKPPRDEWLMRVACSFSTLNWVELVETPRGSLAQSDDFSFQYPQLGRIG